VADRDLPLFEDHRHAAPTLGQRQHLLEEGVVLLDVVVLDLVLFVREGLPGRGGVRSGVLPEDPNRWRHGTPLEWSGIVAFVARKKITGRVDPGAVRST
jgi:hypothetical protein